MCKRCLKGRRRLQEGRKKLLVACEGKRVSLFIGSVLSSLWECWNIHELVLMSCLEHVYGIQVEPLCSRQHERRAKLALMCFWIPLQQILDCFLPWELWLKEAELKWLRQAQKQDLQLLAANRLSPESELLEIQSKCSSGVAAALALPRYLCPNLQFPSRGLLRSCSIFF